MTQRTRRYSWGWGFASFNAELVTLDIIWRFKQAKQLDYAEDMASFERMKETVISSDRAPRTIRTTHNFRAMFRPRFGRERLITDAPRRSLKPPGNPSR